MRRLKVERSARGSGSARTRQWSLLRRLRCGRTSVWLPDRCADRGRPVPIVMMSAANALSTDSHWTVAIGYELDESAPSAPVRCAKVHLYDNNFPDQECFLSPNSEQQCFVHSLSGVSYRTYWPNNEFLPRTPQTAAAWFPL